MDCIGAWITQGYRILLGIARLEGFVSGNDLRQAFQFYPSLKVIVCNGYFDLATPYLATEYTYDHIELQPAQQENITMKYYKAGHMMYLHIPSLDQLTKDLKEFIDHAIV